MEYVKKEIGELAEHELRNIWIEEYCDLQTTIYTHDGILVKFYPDMFEHAFFESENRRLRDKSTFSVKRCERMHWIKDVLEDENATIKQGWDRDAKTYVKDRRAAIVSGNYVVIIRKIREGVAKFVTAYELEDQDSLNKFLNGPDWNKEDWKEKK